MVLYLARTKKNPPGSMVSFLQKPVWRRGGGRGDLTGPGTQASSCFPSEDCGGTGPRRHRSLSNPSGLLWFHGHLPNLQH